MQNERRQVLVETMAAATADGLLAGNIADGTLMSPAETRSVLRGRSGPESGFDGWWAHSDIHPHMHAMFDTWKGEIPTTVTQVSMGTGVDCLVVLHQVRQWQHQFCIPLLGDTIACWVDSIRQGAPLQVSLSADKGKLAMTTKLVIPSSSAWQIPNPTRTLPSDLTAFAEEFMAVALWGTLKGALGAVPEQPAPERICLSLLMPPEIKAFREALAHRQSNPAWFER